MNKTVVGWKSERLGNILKVINGFAFKSNLFNDDRKGVSIVRIRDLSNGNSKTYYSGDYKEAYIVNNGDFLIGMDGEFKIYEWKGGKALLNQRVCKLTNFSEIIIPRYVYYLIKEKLQIIEDSTPFVTVKHISSRQIENIVIPLPSIQTQKQIVAILERAKKLKEKRKLANEITNQILQSVFLKMFGDPIKNPRKWSLRKLNELARNCKSAIKAGPFGSSLKKEFYIQSGYKIYGQEQVISNDLTIGDYYISKEKYEEMSSYKITSGDVLISCVGTFGKVSIVPDNFKPGIINPRLIKISPDLNNINSIYLKYLLINESMKKKILNYSHGGTMGIINLTILKHLDLMTPPIKLQNRFADIVEKLESLSKKQKYSMEQADRLFDGLMQKAFTGELVK